MDEDLTCMHSREVRCLFHVARDILILPGSWSYGTGVIRGVAVSTYHDRDFIHKILIT